MENIHSAAPLAAGQSARFAQVELPIIRDKRLTDTDFRIYSALVAHRNAGHGKAWPKRQTIADLANVHPETVTRSTAKLVECGYLVKTGGKGRGHSTVYTFPAADARQAQRKQTQQAKQPDSKVRDRKPRAERKASQPAGFCAATPYTGTDSVETVFTPPPPSFVPEAIAEGEIPGGENLVVHEDQGEGDLVRHHSKLPPQDAEDAEPRVQEIAKQLPKAPKRRFAFHQDVTPKQMALISVMLSDLDQEIGQGLVDEMSGNMRRHTVHNPISYMRKLLSLWRGGRLTFELEDLERARRERLQQHERIRQANEQRHLQALAQGHAPPTPPPVAMNRTADDEARAEQAIREAKLAARGGLLTAEQRETARQAYLGSKPSAPTPAVVMDGENEALAMDFFAKMRAKLNG